MKKNNRRPARCLARKLSAFGAALLVNAVFVAVLAAESKPRVGLSIVLSGPWASWGTPIKNGVLLGAEYSGGVFELDIQDDQCQARQALSNLGVFSSRGERVLLIGCVETLEAVAPVAGKNGSIIIALGGMTKEILARQPNVTGFFPLTDGEVRYLVPYMRDTQVRTLAVIRGTNLFGEIIGPGLVRAAEANGIRITSEEPVAQDTRDFKSLAQKIIKQNPAALFIHQSESSTGLAVRQFREAGYSGRIFVVYTFESEEARHAGGTALEGVEYAYPQNDRAADAAFRQFADRYRERFGSEPNNDAAAGYDLAAVLTGAFKKCGPASPECVQSQVRGIGSFEGMGGRLIMSPNGAALRPFGIKRYQNGKYEWVKRDLVPLAPVSD